LRPTHLLRVNQTLQLGTLAPRARTSRNIVRDPVAPCHPKVSGIGGSFDIETHSLIRGQDLAPVDSPLGKPRPALAGLAYPNLISRCPAAQVDMVAGPSPPNSSSSGGSLIRPTSTRMGLVVTQDRASSGATPISPCLCAVHLFDMPACLKLSLLDNTTLLTSDFLLPCHVLRAFLLCSISIFEKIVRLCQWWDRV